MSTLCDENRWMDAFNFKLHANYLHIRSRQSVVGLETQTCVFTHDPGLFVQTTMVFHVLVCPYAFCTADFFCATLEFGRCKFKIICACCPLLPPVTLVKLRIVKLGTAYCRPRTL